MLRNKEIYALLAQYVLCTSSFGQQCLGWQGWDVHPFVICGSIKLSFGFVDYWGFPMRTLSSE